MNDGTAKSQTHYQQAAVEPIEIMQMYLSHEEFIGFLRGNLIKYALRAKFKNAEWVDLAKAQQYAAWLSQALQGQKIDPREG
jgi:hypothetical protein